MYRHELRFVLRLGMQRQFNELVRRLHAQESARGWVRPTVWRATSGLVNQIVVEHDYESVEAFRRERSAFRDQPGEVGETLAGLGALAVPGTAAEFEFDGYDLGRPESVDARS